MYSKIILRIFESWRSLCSKYGLKMVSHFFYQKSFNIEVWSFTVKKQEKIFERKKRFWISVYCIFVVGWPLFTKITDFLLPFLTNFTLKQKKCTKQSWERQKKLIDFYSDNNKEVLKRVLFINVWNWNVNYEMVVYHCHVEMLEVGDKKILDVLLLPLGSPNGLWTVNSILV